MSEITFSAPDFGSNPIQYLRDVRAELKKVVWPNKEQVTKATIMVFSVSLVVGAILGGLDYLFTSLFTLLIK